MDFNVDFSELSNNMYIIIGGGIMVIALAWFIFKSGPKNISKQHSKQTENEKNKANLDADTNENDSKIHSASKWITKVNILKTIRSMKKQNIEEEKTETIVPVLVQEVTDIIEDDDQSQELLSEPVVSSIDDTLLEEIQAVTQSEESEAEDITSDDIIEPVENVVEVTEIEQSPPVVLSEEPEKKKEKSSADDIFSMFTDEDAEEDDMTKIASSLDDLDINDLIKEINDIKRYLRK